LPIQHYCVDKEKDHTLCEGAVLLIAQK